MTIDMTMAPPPTALVGQDLGNPILASFSFTDGSIGDYTATIDWGDGTVADGLITQDPDGLWDVSGDYTYSSPGPMNIEVTVQGDGEGSSGLIYANVGTSSGGGSTSGGGSGSGGDSGSGGGGTMPDGMGQDLALIAQNSNLSVNPELLPFSYLMVTGGTPWDDLRPGQLVNESISSTSTQTVNGTTTTTKSSTTSSYTTDGSPGSSGGGSWSIDFQLSNSSSQTVTGLDSSGRNSTSTATDSSDLTWDAWGSNGGPTHYHVVSDDTEDDSLSVKAGSYDEESDRPNDAHLTADGVVGTDGSIISGTFTYNGSIGNQFSLTDGSGSPNGPGVGDSVSYDDNTSETLSEAGDLIPDSSSQGGITLNSSETGDISITDGQGGFDGVTRADADTVTEKYAGSQPAAGSNNGGGTTGTVSAGSTPTNLQIPNGKNTVTVIDYSDQGWFSWTGSQRQKYANDHGFDWNQYPTGNIANGTSFKQNLIPPSGASAVDASPGVQQVVNDLGVIVSQSGKIDVLVIGDHGGSGVQELGNDALTPRINIFSPSLLDKIVGCMKSGGTLVLAGCSTFGLDKNGQQTAINAWQAYATARNITIIGSVSSVGYGGGEVTGVWVTLTPGGTPPTITK
jgi:hypothetical protein